jgi:hypothetical protein
MVDPKYASLMMVKEEPRVDLDSGGQRVPPTVASARPRGNFVDDNNVLGNSILDANIQDQSWVLAEQMECLTEPLGGKRECNQHEQLAVDRLLLFAFNETNYQAGSNRHKKLFVTETRGIFKGMELLSYKSCAAPGCSYEARLMRSPGLIFLYRKGNHDIPSHYRSPIKKQGSRSSLMKPVAARRIHDSLFVKPASAVYDSLARDQLLTTRQILLSDKEVKDEVAAAVYKKRKTIREGQNNRYLSLAYLKHILDDAVVEDLSKFVPNASRGSYSVNANAPLNEIPPGFGIVRHNVGDDPTGKWDEIVILMPGLKEILAGANAMANHPLRSGSGLQGELDFSAGMIDSTKQGGVKNSHQVGAIGVCDFERTFFPLVVVLSKSENTESSNTLISTADDVVSIGSTTMILRLLKDKGKALSSAAKGNQKKERDCVAHAFRGPQARGGGKKGSTGSLQRFLNDSKKKLQSATKRYIMEVATGFRFLQLADDHHVARQLFLEELDVKMQKDKGIESIKQNLLSEYIKPDPSFGTADLVDGEPTTTASGERFWRTNKAVLDLDTHWSNSQELPPNDVLKVFHALFRSVSLQPDFKTEPKRERSVYARVLAFSRRSGKSAFEYRLGCYFIDGKEVSARACVGNSQSYTVYIPRMYLIELLKRKVSVERVDSAETLAEAEAMEATSGNDSLATNVALRHAYIPLQDKCLTQNVSFRLNGESLQHFFMRRCSRDMSSWTKSANERNKSVLFFMDLQGTIDDREKTLNDQESHDAMLRDDKECLSDAKKPEARGTGGSTLTSSKKKSKAATKGARKPEDPFQNLCFESMRKHGTREMGHFIKIDIIMDNDGNFHYVRCFCEEFRHTGRCFHSNLYEVAHGMYPPPEMIHVGEDWGVVSKDVKTKLCDYSYLDDNTLNRAPLNDPLYKVSGANAPSGESMQMVDV